PNDEILASAGSDKVIRLWNAKTLTPKLNLEDHDGPIYGLSFHQNGRRLAAAGWDHKNRILDSRSGLLIKSWLRHERRGHLGNHLLAGWKEVGDQRDRRHRKTLGRRIG